MCVGLMMCFRAGDVTKVYLARNLNKRLSKRVMTVDCLMWKAMRAIQDTIVDHSFAV